MNIKCCSLIDMCSYLGGVSWYNVFLMRVFWKLKMLSVSSFTQWTNPRSINAVREGEDEEEEEEEVENK